MIEYLVGISTSDISKTVPRRLRAYARITLETSNVYLITLYYKIPPSLYTVLDSLSSGIGPCTRAANCSHLRAATLVRKSVFKDEESPLPLPLIDSLNLVGISTNDNSKTLPRRMRA